MTANLRPLCEPLSLSLMSSDSHRQLDRIRRGAIALALARALALPLILSIAKSTLVQADLTPGSP